jgi:hypothetical protein
MFTFVDHSQYHHEPMYCPTCGWEGHGHQLKESEEMAVLQIKEVYCPECNRYMGQFSTDAAVQEDDLYAIPLPELDWL